jgi:type IV pilus assembly protein PilC
MAIFRYKALNTAKKRVEGLIEAENEYEAGEILKEKELTIFSLRKESGFGKEIKILNFFNRVKKKDLVILFRQFSVMISASVNIVQALRILVEQTENIRLKIIVSEIADEVDSGSRLSDSFERRSDVFSNFYINVVRSGETSGKLDEVLNYLANEIEKDYDLSMKIRGAMIYPVFILSGLLVVGTIMMVVVIPKLTDILEEAGAGLPLSTKIIIGISNFISGYWWLILAGLVGFFTVFYFYSKTETGRRRIDFFTLKLPVFGELLKKIYVTRFARTMHTLIAGGVTINQSLSISAEVIDNKIYQDLIIQTAKSVDDGNSISSVFLENKEMPKMVTQIINIGEKTGKLDVVLEKIADFYTREINNTVANLMILLEPIILVIMGIGVGVMVAGIIMPMYNMASVY